MMEVASQTTNHDPVQHIRRSAAERFQHATDWVSFYREILGVEGLVDQLFPSFQKRGEFEHTETYAEIQQMLAQLREKNSRTREPDEPTRVITVRLPRSLHEALRHEAYHHKTSMNKLCISKLLQVIADDLVPSDFERRDGERPARATDADGLPGENARTLADRPARNPARAPLSELSPGELTPSGLTSAPLPSSDTLGGGRPF